MKQYPTIFCLKEPYIKCKSTNELNLNNSPGNLKILWTDWEGKYSILKFVGYNYNSLRGKCVALNVYIEKSNIWK